MVILPISVHPKLIVDIKGIRRALLKRKTKAQLVQKSNKFYELTRTHANFIGAVRKLRDDDLFEDLSFDVTKCL